MLYNNKHKNNNKKKQWYQLVTICFSGTFFLLLFCFLDYVQIWDWDLCGILDLNALTDWTKSPKSLASLVKLLGHVVVVIGCFWACGWICQNWGQFINVHILRWFIWCFHLYSLRFCNRLWHHPIRRWTRLTVPLSFTSSGLQNAKEHGVIIVIIIFFSC